MTRVMNVKNVKVIKKTYVVRVPNVRLQVIGLMVIKYMVDLERNGEAKAILYFEFHWI